MMQCSLLTFQRSGDVHRASAKVKDALPGSRPGAEKDLKNFGAEAGAKIDKAVRTPDCSQKHAVIWLPKE